MMAKTKARLISSLWRKHYSGKTEKVYQLSLGRSASTKNRMIISPALLEPSTPETSTYGW